LGRKWILDEAIARGIIEDEIKLDKSFHAGEEVVEELDKLGSLRSLFDAFVGAREDSLDRRNRIALRRAGDLKGDCRNLHNTMAALDDLPTEVLRRGHAEMISNAFRRESSRELNAAVREIAVWALKTGNHDFPEEGNSRHEKDGGAILTAIHAHGIKLLRN
jgi:hypothetical protein